MSRLDALLEVSDNNECFNCSTDDIDIPKGKIKALMLEIAKSCSHTTALGETDTPVMRLIDLDEFTRKVEAL